MTSNFKRVLAAAQVLASLDGDIATWLEHALASAAKCNQIEQAQMAAGYLHSLRSGIMFGGAASAEVRES